MDYNIPMMKLANHDSLLYITSCYVGIECELLTAQDNGSITIGPRTVGSLVIYTCDDGFTLNVPTPAFRTCQLNGSWSEDQPTCDRKCTCS